jgi:hypothetical protein
MRGVVVYWLGPAGISPPRATYFLRRQKVGKKLSPAKPPLRGSLRCSKPRAAPNSLRSLRSLHSNSRRESVLEACCARALGFCASRRFRRGGPQTAEQPTAKPESRLAPAVPYAPLSTAEQRKALRACAQRTSRADSAQLFEQSVAARVLRGPSRTEQRRAPRSEAQGRCGRGELFAYFLAAQKVSRPPGRTPGMGLATKPKAEALP